MKQSYTIVVFGSSRPVPGSIAYENARKVGGAIARAGWRVATGGYRGIMEAASQGAKEAGGTTIGVTTDFVAARGIAPNRYIDTETRVPTYAERLLKLTELGDGYVVLPGGSGTLTEFFFVWELVKNGSLPRRPIVLFGDVWRRIIDSLAAELANEDSFARFRHLLEYAETPEAVVGHLAGGLK